jgi:hypothetical protein
MRAFPFVGAGALVCAIAVLGCNQDYAASNSDRQPFMEGRAATPPSAASSSGTAPVAPAPASGAPAPATH